MPILTLNLPEEAIRTVREQVDSGLFADENAFIYEAIRQVDVREYESKLQKLKAIIAEGDEQIRNGDCGSYSLEDLNRDMEAELCRDCA